MPNISWLHLSDMHISENNSSDQKVIQEAFFTDLESQLEKSSLDLDFVFFTGDIAYSASRNDYKLANEFFNALCKRIGIKKDSLFVVPGNHDVNRLKVSKPLDDIRRSLSTREEIADIIENKDMFEHYLTRFDHYSEFVSNLYGSKYEMNSENYFSADIRLVDEVEFGIIGLNSAWASYGGRHDCNNIYISEIQLKTALEKVKTASIKIVLLHHPLSWLYEEDKVDIENMLYEHSHIVLHGHLHRPDFQVVNSMKGHQIVIPAGAIYTGRRISNCYNIASLDSGTAKINIIPRRYYDGARKFLKDIESLGNDEINFFETDIPQPILADFRKV